MSARMLAIERVLHVTSFQMHGCVCSFLLFLLSPVRAHWYSHACASKNHWQRFSVSTWAQMVEGEEQGEIDRNRMAAFRIFRMGAHLASLNLFRIVFIKCISVEQIHANSY